MWGGGGGPWPKSVICSKSVPSCATENSSNSRLSHLFLLEANTILLPSGVNVETNGAAKVIIARRGCRKYGDHQLHLHRCGDIRRQQFLVLGGKVSGKSPDGVARQTNTLHAVTRHHGSHRHSPAMW